MFMVIFSDPFTIQGLSFSFFELRAFAKKSNGPAMWEPGFQKQPELKAQLGKCCWIGPGKGV